MAKTEDGMKPYNPDPEKATVVFMRPSAFGGAIQSSVYQYDQTDPKFIGIISTNYKIAYQAEPGQHTFMVVGENADFLEADLAANHIYYVTVEPHWGAFKARFSLDPIPESEFATEDFKDDLAECHFVQNTPASLQWFGDNKADIIEKHDYFYTKWQEKPAEERHRLAKTDGRPL
ncbi:MAG: hypothetical protein JEY79_12195 [Pseudodesulfovibrio sp.]|nr:hypothetical protein [Pseudodesulfovibrio sp.]